MPYCSNNYTIDEERSEAFTLIPLPLIALLLKKYLISPIPPQSYISKYALDIYLRYISLYIKHFTYFYIFTLLFYFNLWIHGPQ